MPMLRTTRQLLDEPIHTPPFIIRPYLPVGGKMFLYAPKKHYKSMLLFNILYDLAEGVPVLGEWDIGQPYTVLLIEQEVGLFMLKNRLSNIHNFRWGSTAVDNLNVVSKERNLKLDDPEGFNQLRQLIEGCRPHVVALDPIRKFHRQDENDSTAITRVVDRLDALIQEFGITFIITHHQGHEFVGQTNRHMRGSSVWGDEADTIINLSRPVSNDRNVIRLTVEEVRHSAVPGPMDFRFDPGTFTFNRRENGTQRMQQPVDHLRPAATA